MWNRESLLSAVGLSLLMSMSAAGEGHARYEIIDLGTLGGSSSVALAINNNGQVVGSADTSAGYRHAYIWDPTTQAMTDLGTLPPYPQSEAWDVNDLGEAVGISTTSGSITKATLWQNGEIINLGDLGTPDVAAFGINNATQITGKINMGFSVFHVYLWEDGVFQDLGTLGGTRALGWDINESGAIAGESWTGGVPGGAFLWKDGSMINLGTLGGGGSEAFGLNDAEQVVGCAQRLEGNFCHAFLWENGEMTDIGALGGFASSQAKAINNHGQVVGGPSFLYEPDTGMADLHDLIPADSGWSSLSPRDLNDSGQIVGYGYVDGHGRAFLMNPLPAPLSPRPRSVHMGNGIALRLGINRRDAHHCAVLNLIGRAACTHIHGFVIPLEPSPLR